MEDFDVPGSALPWARGKDGKLRILEDDTLGRDVLRFSKSWWMHDVPEEFREAEAEAAKDCMAIAVWALDYAGRSARAAKPGGKNWSPEERELLKRISNDSREMINQIHRETMGKG